MAKGGGTQETNTIAQPWATSRPFLRRTMGRAENIYENGGFRPARVKGFNDLENQGRGGIIDAVQGADGIFDAVNSGYQDLLSNAAGHVRDIGPAGPVRDVSAPGGIPNVGPAGPIRDIGPTGSVRDVSAGSQADLEQVRQGILADVLPAVNDQFSNSGMAGSGLHADRLARSASQALAPTMFGAQEALAARQLQAGGMNQSADSANMGARFREVAANQGADATRAGMGMQVDRSNQAAAITRAQQALQAQQANQGADLARSAQGIQVGMANQNADAQNFGNAMNAFGMAPQIFSGSLVPDQTLQLLGGQQRELEQLQANTQKSGAADAISRYADLIQPFGGLGGSQTTTESGGGPGIAGSIAGAGLQGLGVYGALAANPATAPFALGGAGLAGIASLF